MSPHEPRSALALIAVNPCGENVRCQSDRAGVQPRYFTKVLSHLADDLLEDAILAEMPDSNLHNTPEACCPYGRKELGFVERHRICQLLSNPGEAFFNDRNSPLPGSDDALLLRQVPLAAEARGGTP